MRQERLLLFILFLFLFPWNSWAQEDKIRQVAIDTVRKQMRVPPGIEINFLEKHESSIPGLWAVKLMIQAPDREIPVIVYVDKTGDQVMIGNLFLKGENVTRKEAGEPKPRKIDLSLLDLQDSPSRGPADAKITVVEFSNFT